MDMSLESRPEDEYQSMQLVCYCARKNQVPIRNASNCDSMTGLDTALKFSCKEQQQGN